MSDKKKRITVSLDPSVAAGLQAAADSAGAASVSEYVKGVLEDRLARDQWMDRWRAAAGDVDPVALEYAMRSLLGGRASPRSQAS